MPVIMGRKTYQSMKSDLPGRINIVVTSRKDWKADGVSIAHNLDDALALAKDADTREIFIIGGGEIFKETMDIVDRIYLTRVHVTIDGDTKYPEISPSIWKKVSERFHDKDDKHNYSFTFEVWERK